MNSHFHIAKHSHAQVKIDPGLLFAHTVKQTILHIVIHESASDAWATREILERLGWTKLLRVGWDHYYSNRPEHQSATGRIDAIEIALSYFVEYTLQRQVPSRRDLLEGVTTDLSRTRVDHLKKMVKGRRFRQEAK